MEEDRLVQPIDIGVAERTIQKRIPGLKIDSIQYLGGGSYSVFAVNDEVIFRFPKYEAASALAAFEVENKALELIRPRVSPHKIPTPLYQLTDVDDLFPGPVYGYKLLSGGRVLDSIEVREHLPHLLGDFLTRLHKIDLKLVYELGLDRTSADAVRQGWHDAYEELTQTVLPILNPEERRWVDNLYETYLSAVGSVQPPVVLAHGDLGDENVLLPGELDRLHVIDFEDAGPNDPAVDFCIWWGMFGDGFIDEMIGHYGLNTGDQFMSRVAFYYNRIPMIYFKFGVVNDNDKFIRYGHDLLQSRMMEV